MTNALCSTANLCYEMAVMRVHQSRQPRRPTFLWQGLLIVLPVVVLAGIGLLAVQQDRQQALREARQQAQTFADDIAAAFERWLAETNGVMRGEEYLFVTDARGELVWPAPWEPVPVPRPLDLSKLSADHLSGRKDRARTFPRLWALCGNSLRPVRRTISPRWPDTVWGCS